MNKPVKPAEKVEMPEKAEPPTKATKLEQVEQSTVLIELVRKAHELYLHGSFGQLQQDEFFTKIAAIYKEGVSK